MSASVRPAGAAAGHDHAGQFVDLNDKIGGADIDLNRPPANDATEPALTNVYRSGGINETNNLPSVAIIDLRGPDPARSTTRTEAGRSAPGSSRPRGTSRSITSSGSAIAADRRSHDTTEGLLAMDRGWLGAVESDDGSVQLGAKVTDDRAGDVKTNARTSAASTSCHCRASGRCGSSGSPDEVRDACDGRRREHRDGRRALSAEAAAHKTRLLRLRTRWGEMSVCSGGRVRTEQRSIDRSRRSLANLFPRRRQRHLRRHGARSGARRIGRRLGERVVQLRLGR